jgi:Fuc2NAc and GlcNAc transferase
MLLDWTLKYWIVFTFLLYGLSIAAIGIYYSYAINRGILDLPNSRSSHKVITPRGGGLPIVFLWGILLGWVIYQFHLPYQTALIFGPALVVGYLGYIDDRKSLSAFSRLLVHILSAVIVLIALGASKEYVLPLYFLPIWAVFLLLTISLVWFTNLFNFMDGMDGIAGTEALFFFGLASYIFWQSGSDVLMVLSWGLFALVSGFLTWNWPPARIFLGDTGSGFLGMLMAIFALVGSIWYGVSIFVWLIISGVFWFDASVTLIRRLLCKENIMTAHCSHAYQRLLQRQFSHRTVLLMIMAVNSLLTWMAYMVYLDPQIGLIMFIYASMLLTGLYLIVEYLKPMFKTWHST